MARILLADDDTTLRDLAQRALAADGHVLTIASDGSEAAQHLASGSFDLLVSDVEMPGCGGFDLVRDFAPRHPRLAFLIVSGFVERLNSENAAQFAPRVRTLAKPFTLEQLRAAVANSLG
ncbi:MAG: response regulator [Hyphomicrobiaceae bacterium]